MSSHLRNLLDDYFQVKTINLFLDTLQGFTKKRNGSFNMTLITEIANRISLLKYPPSVDSVTFYH
jgi:hypothetical protein